MFIFIFYWNTTSVNSLLRTHQQTAVQQSIAVHKLFRPFWYKFYKIVFVRMLQVSNPRYE
jgi:hypothetical protein